MIKHFHKNSIIPHGMEKSFTYSQIDDSYLFKKKKASLKALYGELTETVKKEIDPDCQYLPFSFYREVDLFLSIESLFYLFSYFYCRFCYLSPYHRPLVSLSEIAEGEFHLLMHIKNDALSRFPNFEEIFAKAQYLATLSGFVIEKQEEENTVVFYFLLKEDTSGGRGAMYILPYLLAKRWCKAAAQASKNDMEAEA